MILLLLAIGAGPWSAADEAELAPVRAAFGFSEGMRALEIGEHVPAEACGACHPQVYREWRESRHSHSATNALFLAGFEAEPTIRCVRCHAPLEEQAKPFARHLKERRIGASTPALEQGSPAFEGIGCAACHLRGGVVLTARPIETKEHPTRFEPLLRDPRFCASCHQFRFERGRALTDHVTQDTWREWREVAAELGGKDCRACHMDRGSHLFPGAHDRDLLARSIEVRARGRSLAIRSIGVGHRMPTGDLFRHLVVQVERDRKWTTIAELGRRFEIVRDPESGRHLKRLAEDTTLAADEVRWLVAGRADRWRVLYRFTRDGDVERVIAEGSF